MLAFFEPYTFVFSDSLDDPTVELLEDLDCFVFPEDEPFLSAVLPFTTLTELFDFDALPGPDCPAFFSLFFLVGSRIFVFDDRPNSVASSSDIMSKRSMFKSILIDMDMDIDIAVGSEVGGGVGGILGGVVKPVGSPVGGTVGGTVGGGVGVIVGTTVTEAGHRSGSGGVKSV